MVLQLRSGKLLKVAAVGIFSTPIIVLFEIHQTLKGHFLNELCISFKNLSKGLYRLFSRDRIDWKVKLRIRLNHHVIWVQPNIVNVNGMDYGRWNDWDGGNEAWSMKYSLKEIRWKMNSEVWTEGNEMKHE